MNFKDFIVNLLNTIIDGSFEKIKLVNQMNAGFKEYFYTGELNRLCKTSICQGDPDFKHELSSIWFRSGFKISIENDSNLKDSEIIDISQYVLNNAAFIKQLMAMGFDTLIVQGSNNKKGKKFSLKAYSNLKDYFIQ